MILERNVLEAAENAGAGIVDPHVDTAEFGYRRAGELFHFLGIAYVGGDPERAHAGISHSRATSEGQATRPSESRQISGQGDRKPAHSAPHSMMIARSQGLSDRVWPRRTGLPVRRSEPGP